jgi:hypothetical protein
MVDWIASYMSIHTLYYSETLFLLNQPVELALLSQEVARNGRIISS